MAKKSVGKKLKARSRGGRPPSGRPKAKIVVQIRAHKEWEVWLEEARTKLGMGISELFDAALIVFAERYKIRKPPKR